MKIAIFRYIRPVLDQRNATVFIMKEINAILQLYRLRKMLNEHCAIAQVVHVEESSYRREGARMLVFESGVFEGGISGGCLEGDALKRSQMAILKQKPSLVRYDTSKDNEIGVGLGCNGIIDVLIRPITENTRTLELLERCTQGRSVHLLATVVALSGTIPGISLGSCYYGDTLKMEFEDCSNTELKAFLEQCAIAVRSTKKSGMHTFEKDGASAGIFLEYIPPRYHLAVFGDNYDLYPILEVAQVLDWEISLVGNLQKLDKSRLDGVHGLFDKEAALRPEIDAHTAIVLMAHDYRTDYDNLKRYWNGNAAYIGCLGPRKRFDRMLHNLKQSGIRIDERQEKRIFAPCGLEIGANTPEEIALSLFGEILSVFNGKKGGMLREKEGPIHTRNY